MKVFTGTTWSKERQTKCIEYNIGMLTSPQDPLQPDMIPSEIPVVFDNGAFFAYRRGKPFDEELFYSRLNSVERELYFVTVPDVVGNGEESYKLSLNHIQNITHKKYFVVQDRMYWDAVYYAAASCDGVFIGGSIPWKWDTASYWIGHAHEIGLPVHIGRVSSFKDLDNAYMLGADSVDGSTIIRHNLLERIPLFRSHILEQRRFDHRYSNLCKAVMSEDIAQNETTTQKGG
jgi:hypothetical protein